MPFAETIVVDIPRVNRFRPAAPVRFAYVSPVYRKKAIMPPPAAIVARNPGAPVVLSADDKLTAIERTTIALSLGDPIASVKPQGRYARSGLAILLFGPRRTFVLANPRLEALRRYAILFRHADPEAAAAAEALREAGYSAGQIDEIGRRSAPTRRKGRAWISRFWPAAS